MNPCQLSSHIRSPATLVVLTILLVTSCMNRNKKDEIRNASRDLDNSTTAFIYNAIPQQQNASITPEYSTAINTFSVKLLSEVYRDQQFIDKNVVLSPFSLSRCLAVLTEGATGSAQSELLTLLGGQEALDDAKEALAELLYTDPSVVFQCADAVWIDSTRYTLQPAFMEKARTKYGVACTGLDFSEVTRVIDTVNSWTSTNTLYNITEIINENVISSQTILILTNAVYFEADWSSPFDITLTQPKPFDSPEGLFSVPMMTSDYQHDIYKSDVYENAKLYYGKADADFFYLDIYMPVTISVKEFLEGNCLQALSRKDSTEYGSLTMPKFRFQSDVDMIPILLRLGVTEIFNPMTNDLSDIVSNVNGREKGPLYVDKIRHKAGIETDEEGTKAYAVTAIAAAGRSAEPPPAVVVDKPFIYFIRAGKNGLILFAGVVNNPNDK